MFDCLKKKRVLSIQPNTPDHFQIALTYLGTTEVKGVSHNQTIVDFFMRVIGKPLGDEVAWCAAFVGSCLTQAGLTSTRSLGARSYLAWGEGITPKDAAKGDVLVFWRGSPVSWKGHVGFYSGEDEKYYYVLGGNQKDSVCIQKYKKSKLLGVRRA